MRMQLRRSAQTALLWQLPAGLLAGITLVYFWDRAQGQARRQHVRDTVNYWIAQGRERALHKAAHAVPEENDATLLQRVQSEIFRDSSLLRDVLNVDSQAGVITLRGTIDEPARMLALVAAVQDVSGVIEVRNLLHLPETPAPNKAPSLAASHTVTDQAPPAQAVPATPKDAALAGAEVAAGTLVTDAPQPTQSTHSASGNSPRAKAAPVGDTSKARAAKRQAAAATEEKHATRTTAAQRASEKKRTSAARRAANAQVSATQKGKTMQTNSDQEPIPSRKSTQDDTADSIEWNAQPRQSDTGQLQPTVGNDSGLPGGGVGRREAPGKTGVYPLSASQDANPDSPLQSEGSFGQSDRGTKGHSEAHDSAILMGDDEQADQGNAHPS